MAITSYRDLRTWQAAMSLIEETYRLASRLPPSERFGIAAQLRRASVGVAANIAEGYGRRTRADYVHFLHIAYGSLQETETLLLVAERVGLVPASQLARPLDACATTGRLLRALIASLKARTGRPRPQPPAPSAHS
jgi:four helix bundle protein